LLTSFMLNGLFVDDLSTFMIDKSSLY